MSDQIFKPTIPDWLQQPNTFQCLGSLVDAAKFTRGDVVRVEDPAVPTGAYRFIDVRINPKQGGVLMTFQQVADSEINT